MPKIRNSVSRTTRFRRKPYSHLPERAPLPDLVALHENGTLFSDPRAMTESVTEEEIAGTQKLKSRSEFNTAQLHPHPRPSDTKSQAGEDNLPNPESGHNTSRISQKTNTLPIHLLPQTPTPTSNITTHRLPIPPPKQTQTQYRLTLSANDVADSPISANTFMEIPILASEQRELEIQASQTHQDLRFRNPISESQTQRNNWRNQEREYHNRKTRNHYATNPPRQQGKIRLRKNVPPHPRTRYSFISESPDASQYLHLPSPPPPQLLPPTQYISAILSLRASTRNPYYFPLPEGIQLFGDFPQQQKKKTTKKEKEQEIDFLALQMEQVEDAIRLEGAPEAAREVYYAQFARGEY
ncbi:hypothetical protein BCON_0001g01280 [Botryotinia convoluta]|uniref:Uncharacterized protein n=1 Tax=Botryotinia convoluta TaxID=54673 RepID=A0A4Z1J2E5_9HELO|nr:hypothetical protein BCON_0001g01280 [Botryotinia convoluta]